MDAHNKPNVVLPLAASYNQRGIYSTSAAQGQRKVNSYYEVVENNLTGNKTLYLAKRPGLAKASSDLANSVEDFQYLIISAPNTGSDTVWVASTRSSAVRVSDNGGGTSGLFSADGYTPVYFDKAIVSGTENAVLQTRHESSTDGMKAFYASTIGSWTEISASAYTTLIKRGKMEFIDGFAFQMTSDNRIYNSNINTLQTWNAVNYIAKAIQADRAGGLARHGNILLAFGDETVEGFRNAGTPVGSPLQRIPELQQKIGLVPLLKGTSTPAFHYYATIAGVMYFLGNTKATPGSSQLSYSIGLFSFDGSSFKKVSPPAIDKLLTGFGTAVQQICSISFSGKDAVVIQTSAWALAVGSQATALVYFPAVGDWFEWGSTLAQFASAQGVFMAATGSGTNGNRLYTFDNDNWYDGSAGGQTSFDMIQQFKLPKNDNARASMPWAGVVADTISASASTSAHGDANLYISFSDNDYASFSTPRVIDLSTREKRITRCGSFKDRVVRLVHSANAECRIQQFIAKTL